MNKEAKEVRGNWLVDLYGTFKVKSKVDALIETKLHEVFEAILTLLFIVLFFEGFVGIIGVGSGIYITLLLLGIILFGTCTVIREHRHNDL